MMTLTGYRQANRYTPAAVLLGMLLLINNPAWACTVPKSYYKHVSCTASSRYFLAVKDSGAPVALLGKDGKKKVDLSRYTQVEAGKLRSGLLPVKRAGKVGYVNLSGREVIPAIYDSMIDDSDTSGWARAASNRRIIVKKNGKLGIISTSGKTVLPFASKYRSISDYDAGVAKVRTNQRTLWVDTQGKSIPNPNPPPPSDKDKPNAAKSAGNINASADAAANPLTSGAMQADKQFAMPSSTPWKPVKRDGKWGYVNEQSVPMITFSFDAAMPFSEGLAGVRVAQNWGFVDLAGNLVIPFRFSESGVVRQPSGDGDRPPFTFIDGKAWIGNLNNGSKLCIDQQGTNIDC